MKKFKEYLHNVQRTESDIIKLGNKLNRIEWFLEDFISSDAFKRKARFDKNYKVEVYKSQNNWFFIDNVSVSILDYFNSGMDDNSLEIVFKRIREDEYKVSYFNTNEFDHSTGIYHKVHL